VITLGKKGTLAAYRDALGYITKEDVAKKVFSVIAPAYADLKGGYTQVLKMGPRRGDGAEMAIVKLVAAPVKEEAVAEEK
jgi:large subunit ribosomal protein L17